MDIRNIRWPEDWDAIAEHIRLVHGPGDVDFLTRWYGTYPGFDPADCFVIEGEQGEIAAHAMLVPRQIRIGPAVLPTAELGVVGTLETYRGKGYASALIERALQRMTERGDALGLVLGIPNFYERWGYEYAVGLYLTSYESDIDLDHALSANRWDRTHSYQRRAAAYLGVRGEEVTVRRYYSSDQAAVMRLYDQESARGRYLIARDDALWEWQLHYLTSIGRYDPDDFLVAEVDDEVVAYLRIVSHGQVNWFLDNEAARFSIVEYAGDHPDAAEALLNAAAQSARDYNAERIGLFVHPESRLMRHALAHGGTLREFTGAGFLRVHDLTRLAELLKPALEARLAGSCYQAGCRLTLITDEAQVTLALGEGGPDVTVELPGIDLVRLVTGWFGIDDLPPGYYSQEQRDLLDVLFPKGNPRIGITDLL